MIYSFAVCCRAGVGRLKGRLAAQYNRQRTARSAHWSGSLPDTGLTVSNHGSYHVKPGNGDLLCGIHTRNSYFISVLSYGRRGVFQGVDVGQACSVRGTVVRFPEIGGATSVPPAYSVLCAGDRDQPPAWDGRVFRIMEWTIDCCRAYCVCLGRSFSCFAVASLFPTA